MLSRVMGPVKHEKLQIVGFLLYNVVFMDGFLLHLYGTYRLIIIV